MRMAVAQGVLAVRMDEGDLLCVRPGLEIARLDGTPRRSPRALAPQGCRRRARLRALSAADPVVLSLSAGGSSLHRLVLAEGHSWQVDRLALVAASGDLAFHRGRRGFYPRGGGRLVRVEGAGEIWIAADPLPTRFGLEEGQANAFDARCVVAFSDGLDSRSRHESLKRATATFSGRGSVLVSPGRQAG